MRQVLKDNERVMVIREDDKVIKSFKNLTPEQNKILTAKLELKDEFKDIQELILPQDYTFKNGVVDEIQTEYIDFPDFYSSTGTSLLPFETICYCMTDLNFAIKQGNEKGMVFPDFPSKGNIKYDPKTLRIFLLDYEDNQIDKLPAGTICPTLINNPLMKTKKYFNRGLFTKDVDIYNLALRWYSLCTGWRLDSEILKEGLTCKQALEKAGIYNDELIMKFTKCFLKNYSNSYFDSEFIDMYLNYELCPTKKMGMRRRNFSKRNVPRTEDMFFFG